MFSNISWSQFIIAIGTIAAIYYLAVAILYYTADIKNALSGKKQKPVLKPVTDPREQSPDSMDQASEPEQDGFSELTDYDLEAIEELVQQLKSVIAEIPPDKRLPDEFKESLQLMFSEYPSVKYSTLRHSVNELVVSEWEKYSAIVLTDEDVDLCW